MRRMCAFVVVFLLAAACGGAPLEAPAPTATSPPASSLAGSGVTVTAPETEPPTTVPPVATTRPAGSDVARRPTLLVAHGGGVDLWTPQVSTPIVEGRKVEVAIPDLAGGVVFSTRDADGNAVVEHVSKIGDEAVVLVADPDAIAMSLTQVTTLEGRRTLLYRKTIELPNDCPDQPEDCHWQYYESSLHAYDLESGTDRVLGVIGSFESDHIEVLFGGDWATVAYSEYGTATSCVTVVPARRLLDGWLSPWPFPTTTDDAGYQSTICPPEIFRTAAIAPDGSGWVMLEGTWPGDEPWVLTAFDPATDQQKMRVELPDWVGEAGAAWIEHDGTYTVLSHPAPTPDFQPEGVSVIVDADGTVAELPITGRATIWPAELPPPAGAPLSDESKVTIRGIGPVRVGMTLEEAEAAAGTALVEEGPRTETGPGGLCWYVRPEDGPDGIAFMMLDGVVARVDIDNPEVETLSGAAVGDSEAAIVGLYPRRIETAGHEYVDDGHYLIFVPVDAEDAGYRVVFESDGDQVTRYRSGRLPEVLFTEGCS